MRIWGNEGKSKHLKWRFKRICWSVGYGYSIMVIVGVKPHSQTFFLHLFWLCPFITIMHWYVGVLSVGGSRLLVSRSQGPHPFLLHDHVLQLRASHLSKQWRKVVLSLNSPLLQLMKAGDQAHLFSLAKRAKVNEIEQRRGEALVAMGFQVGR